MTLNIFSAGVAGKIVKSIIAEYEKETGNKVNLTIGGSVAGVNMLKSGQNFDAMILADEANVTKLMGKEYAKEYDIFASNEMVVIGNDITDENWKWKFIDKNSTILHMNPFDDPGGYRAVMALKLADFYEPSLTKRILSNANYKGMEREAYENINGVAKKAPFMDLKDNEYFIAYKTLAVENKLNFAHLPSIMNLGNYKNEEFYNRVSFVVDGDKEVFGTTIFHVAVVPSNAKNEKEGKAFIDMFLQTDFESYGFNLAGQHVTL